MVWEVGVTTRYANEIVLKEVEPEPGGLTAWAHEAGVVMVDGKIRDVFEGGRRKIPFWPLSRGGVRTFIAYMSPFDIDYWLKDPRDVSEPDNGIPLDSLVLTSDAEPVTGRINITFAVISGMVDLLLRLLGPRKVITKSDVAYALKNEIQPKLAGLGLHRYTAAELRDDHDLRSSIHASLKGDLDLVLSGYGLELDKFFIDWGLTAEQREHIKRQRHDISVQDALREKELKDAGGLGAKQKRSPEIHPTVSAGSPAEQRLFGNRSRRPSEVTTAVSYWVYVDDPTNRARVHIGTCRFCNHGSGLHGRRRSDNRWLGPFENEGEAIEVALSSGRSDVGGCGVCLRGF